MNKCQNWINTKDEETKLKRGVMLSIFKLKLYLFPHQDIHVVYVNVINRTVDKSDVYIWIITKMLMFQ